MCWCARATPGRPSAACGKRCNCTSTFHVSRHLGRTSGFFAGDLTAAAFRLDPPRNTATWRLDRFGAALRGFAQSQVRKELPERQSARHARGHPASPARAGCITDCGASARSARWLWRAPQQRSGQRRPRHRLGPFRLRSLRAHQEILRAHGARTAPDVPRTVFRPSIVLGDSRRPETTQFDMVRAFVFPGGSSGAAAATPTDRVDIVPADYVADAVVTLHQKPNNPRMRSIICRRAPDSETYQPTDRSPGRRAWKNAAAILAGIGRAVRFVDRVAGAAARQRWGMPHRC
jgi:hypothetical protein